MEKENIILDRLDKSILMVLYKNHPIAMTQEEIGEAIEAEGLLFMSDEAFEKYRKDLVAWRKL